jgi:16S rRNA (adenine1518-N6/adenine1519-N6)-dimethyltransferase
MTLSEMKRILGGGGIQLTKSLGQNFLHDGNQLRRIVAAAELARSDKVLEIGPGLGPLTELLIENTGTVLAIEKDGRLVEFLEQRFKVEASHGDLRSAVVPAGGDACAPGRLTLLHADALRYLKETPADWSEWKLVANLPYSVASPILVELAHAPGAPQRLVATLQLEVAQRLVAQAGDPDYGLLSLLVQLQYLPCGWFRIPPSCFHPPPEVDSACVTLQRRPDPLLGLAEARVFGQLVRLGFSQRRKMMFKLLKAQWPLPLLEASFDRLGLSRQARAESVSLDQFVQLTRLLAAP